MDGIGEDGGGIRLSKRFSDDKPGTSAEVDYKTKAGTAWSHSYLNQKPWHPLSYPNQRRKWIAEQTHAQRTRRAEEVAREYSQEQEFFRQTALISKKEKEKMEMMKAVSFMYVRPPGYNAESAKAAEVADERKITEQNSNDHSTTMPPESLPGGCTMTKEKQKLRPKDVFGRALPTEEEFEVLKNAPRLETGVPGRVKPFAVEVRNVKCLRCGNYGHQSGDRDCPLKDIIMPNEESRLKRDDPLTAIMAQMDPTEPPKWELKQKPGLSPPRGGFRPDDPNQQIVAEDIFDEYGGFLCGGNIPDLLTNISCKPKKRKSSKKRKQKMKSSPSCWDSEDPNQDGLSSTSGDDERKPKEEKKTKKKKKRNHSGSSSSDSAEFDRHQRRRTHKHLHTLEDRDYGKQYRTKESREKRSYASEDSDSDRHYRKKKSTHKPYTMDDMDAGGRHRKSKKSRQRHSNSSDDENYGNDRKSKNKHSYSSEDSDRGRHECRKKTMQMHYNSESEDPDTVRRNRSEKYRHKHRYSSEDDAHRHLKCEKSRNKHSSSRRNEDSSSDAERRSKHRRHH
ncbi:uncharacterized zinc finger CCHC domain-containing protein At4g19190-like isoform X2 [Hibiscus syriacus]|uniref:uncharacterized zinc finger CCHC domain-containing protein At4g19190-like isoform X2 n=1 Tax=Hibiscus syriacus TaxID=106335 RepID=UPI0019228420|nr:uncharacterized zinc finger CCHC domain-containing protein At4g19190-like isoform X2 [Hibiscus syriacus]